MRISYLLVLFAAVLVLAPACKKLAEQATEKIAEQAIEKSSGGKAKVDLNGKNGSMKITTNDGKTQTQWGEGAALPEGWPAWLAQYPGSTVTMGNRQAGADRTSFTATLMTKDAPEQVVKFYEDKAAAQGLKSQTKMNMPGNGSMESFVKDDQILSVSCATTSNGNAITLMYEAKPKKGG
jgi:hypothetical protein